MNALREGLAARGAEAQIQAARPPQTMPTFNRVAYQRRNRIERFFSKAKKFRAITTRYEKRDETFLNLIRLASIRIWLRHYESAA